jgi:hypothetical protein
MKPTILIAACFLTAALAQGGGKEVVVAVGWQGAVKGELVKVEDTALVVAVEKDEEELIVVPIRDVRWVVIKGQNYVTGSAALGMVSGGVIGAILGASMADEPSGGIVIFSPAAAGGLEGAGIGALIGLAVGFAVGSSISSKEMSVSPDDSTFRQVLNKAARYPAESDQMNR